VTELFILCLNDICLLAAYDQQNWKYKRLNFN